MQRLSPLDAMFLQQDSPTVPRQIASLAILEPGEHPLDYDRLIHVINERIDLVPRYRQVPRTVPASLGTPVWLDDENFDISLHVRRSALPRPGTTAALHELVGRLIARRLDLDRPLWELYLIEGLSGGRVALLFKAHQALVDGSETVDLAQVLLEETAHDRDIPHEEWNPRSEPNARRARGRHAQPQPAPSRRGAAGRRAQPGPHRPPAAGHRRRRPAAQQRPVDRAVTASPVRVAGRQARRLPPRTRRARRHRQRRDPRGRSPVASGAGC